MKIKFTKDVVIENKEQAPLKRRRWDRWLYLGILAVIFVSFVNWLATPWFFELARGVLLQEQYDVQFTHDIEILEYKVQENDVVKKGDTLFSYKRYSEDSNASNFDSESIQITIKGNEKKSSLIAIEAQIEKRTLFLKALEKRLNYWNNERKNKEKLIYLSVITQNELANVDRSIDEVTYEIATVKAERIALTNERNKLLKSLNESDKLHRSGLNLQHQTSFYIAQHDGKIDRIIRPENQICYREDKVFSITKPDYYVRAYIEVTDLDKFEVGEDVVIVLPYNTNNLSGKVSKMYALSEEKDDVIVKDNMSSYDHGVVVEIVPTSKKGWEQLKVSRIPVKVRKGKINI